MFKCGQNKSGVCVTVKQVFLAPVHTHTLAFLTGPLRRELIPEQEVGHRKKKDNMRQMFAETFLTQQFNRKAK